MPIALATMVEHIGDISAISSTVGVNYIKAVSYTHLDVYKRQVKTMEETYLKNAYTGFTEALQTEGFPM